MALRLLFVAVTAALLFVPQASLASKKLVLCHVPPGNPDNPQTIAVRGRWAVKAHLRHGDTVGACASGCSADTECDDGNLCTADACAEDGSCEHVSVSCDDGDACTSDACVPDAGCLYSANEGASCDDGNACTEADVCGADAVCGGSPLPDCCLSSEDCADGDLCTDDLCIGGMCSNPAKSCSLDDLCGVPGLDNACRMGVCDPTTGGCTSLPTSCDDGDLCTDDLCDASFGCFHRPTQSPPELSEVSCDDGLDNDCDGAVDTDDLDCPLVGCSADPRVGDACDGGDLDNCPDGFFECDANDQIVCTDDSQSSQEICNDADDDCDGTVDEDFGDLTCGIGACQVTVAACVGGMEQLCEPGPPTQEVCDDLVDNDCDGLVDASDSDCADACSTTGGLALTRCSGNTVEECDGEFFQLLEDCAATGQTCVEQAPGDAVCVASTCGDGLTDPGEACDDGNADACGSCGEGCTEPGIGVGCPSGTGCGTGSDCLSGFCTGGTCD